MISFLLARVQIKDNLKQRQYQYKTSLVACVLLLVVTIALSSSFVQAIYPFPSNISENKTISYSQSALGLRFLVYADLQIAKILTGKLHNLPHNSYLRKASYKYLQDLYRGSGIDDRSNFTIAMAWHIAKNPIASYRTIRRMVSLLWDLAIHAKGVFEIPGKVASEYLFRGLPNLNDLQEAMDGIFRLQIVLDFDIKQFSEGYLSGEYTGAKLDAVHCYEIGKYLLNSKEYSFSLNWIEIALIKVTLEGDTTIDRAMVTSLFKEAMEKHDMEFENFNGTSEDCFMDSVDSMIRNGNFSNRKTRRTLEYEEYISNNKFNESPFGYYAYCALCSGNKLEIQSLETQSKLFCWYEFKVHPKFLIGPMKMEFLARNPDVVQMYDVMGDKMIETIKRKTAGNMTRSRVKGEDELDKGRYISSNVRTSENAYLNDMDKEFYPISQAISHLTGLQPGTREYMQIAAYTFSGLYEPHMDTGLSAAEREGFGDRIATFMIYMSDVEKGGETAFPLLGIAARPVKGSALFWYNILRTEEADRMTLHGACPVIIGQKYVANKWIRYLDQFSTRKCSENPHERFEYLVNSKSSDISPITAYDLPVEHQHHLEEQEDPVEDEEEVWPQDTRVLSKYAYGSVPRLKKLAKTEIEIFRVIKAAYIGLKQNESLIAIDEAFETNNLCVQAYLKDFQESTRSYGQIEERIEAVATNPIAAFKMIWRFDHFIKKWVSNDLELGHSYQNTLKDIKRRIYRASEGPDTSDLVQAKLAILTIQNVYSLQATKMATGRVAGRSTGVTLNALQCYSIGVHGIQEKMYTVGIEWLEAALFKTQFTADSSIMQAKVELTLKRAKEEHDVGHANSEGWEPFFYNDKFNETTDTYESVRRVTRKRIQYDYYRFEQDSRFAEINFNGICSGKPHQTPEEKSKLFCWYEKEIHPFWKINPLKAEIHSMHPKQEIVQYYDLISDTTIERLKGYVIPELMKSSTVVSKDRSFDPRLRSSANGWVRDFESEDALKVSKLIERVTGLIVQDTVGEDLQIATYSPGAFYTVHMDVGTEIDNEFNAGRIATFMFYFSDVSLGGHTAFAQAGVGVPPKKGSAVFWYNVFNSGEPLQNTWHGACPVIFGEKWVANRWLMYEMQTKHLCGKDRSTVDEVLVNGRSKYI